MTYPYNPFGGMGFIFLIIFGVLILSCVISIAIAVWAYKDAKKRDMDATMWLAIILLGGCIGCIIYLIVRDPIASNLTEKPSYSHPATIPSQESVPEQYETEKPTQKDTKFCKNCGEKIPFDASFCPICGFQQ